MMRVGVLVKMAAETDFDEEFKKVTEMGMNSCQLVCWDSTLFTDEWSDNINDAVKKHGITITAFWCGWSGPLVWNFYEGQETLGLVPPAFRSERLQILLKGSDFAKKIKATDFVTHVGYIPENPYDPNYPGVITVLKELAKRCKENGQYFLFETGQETPVTLIRAIQDIGYDNLGVNLDPANLLMYGKANPVDALDLLGPYVRGIHGKDGNYPTDGRELGEEMPLGEGRVNYPRFIEKLHSLGYGGDITIEREITGEQQRRDIIQGKKLLEEEIAKLS